MGHWYKINNLLELPILESSTDHQSKNHPPLHLLHPYQSLPTQNHHQITFKIPSTSTVICVPRNRKIEEKYGVASYLILDYIIKYWKYGLASYLISDYIINVRRYVQQLIIKRKMEAKSFRTNLSGEAYGESCSSVLLVYYFT